MPGCDIVVVVAGLVCYLVHGHRLAHVCADPPVCRGVADVIRKLIAVEGIGGLGAVETIARAKGLDRLKRGTAADELYLCRVALAAILRDKAPVAVLASAGQGDAERVVGAFSL